MGFSLVWIAIKGKSPVSVREEIGLRGTDQYEEFPESNIVAIKLPSNWYLIVSQHTVDRLIADEILSRLSEHCQVVSCVVEEHTMYSAVFNWQNGDKIWSVTHDSEHGIEHLKTEGRLPLEFDAICNKLRSEQQIEDRQAAEVDYIFDIPVELAKSLTGYRYDCDIEIEIPELNDQRFEALVFTDNGKKITFLEKLKHFWTK